MYTPPKGISGDYASASQISRQLWEYFAGLRRQFTLPLVLEGTPFQLDVWQAVMQVPYGETRSYADIARAIGRPKAVRAVANAIAANPAWIIVPCHRIICSDGSIGGYEGGVMLKKRLLDMEANYSKKIKGIYQNTLF